MHPTAALTPRTSTAPTSKAANIVDEYRELIFSIANRLQSALRTMTPVDDLFAHGCIGLLEAAQRFKPGRGAQFRTYAFTRIRGAMLDALRREGWQSRAHYAAHRRDITTDPTVELATPVLSSQLPDQVPARPGPSPDDLIDLRSALDRLPAAERAVLDLYYFADEDMTEIAAKLGIKKSWVCRLHARGIDLLKEMLGDNPLG